MAPHFTSEEIDEFIGRMQQQRILVLGDIMLDEFIWGQVNRISPEAPVPVVHVNRESAYPGGAANVARNLADFGITTKIGGMIGEDRFASRLMTLFTQSNISTEAVLSIPSFNTIIKTRIIARHQQVVRVDRETRRVIEREEIDLLLHRLKSLIVDTDAIIIEDYGKGFITQPLVDAVLSLATQHKKVVTVDPNPQNPLDWSGATLVKPNRQEALTAAGVTFDEQEHNIHEIGEILLRKWQINSLLVTLGEEGMILFEPSEPPYHTPTRAQEVYDVSGAGDTVIAFYTAALAAGLSGIVAAEIANHAAGVVVGKLGTATLVPQELIKSFQMNNP